MITLDVVQDGGTPIAAQLSGLASQLPYALSLALNATVNTAQQAVQDSLSRDFHLRRPDFIERTIYRKPGQDFATKTNLVAAVRVNPERDFLAKFEAGGEKRSITGKSLAVPILRLGAPNIIIGRGDPLSVKLLMNAIEARQGRVLRLSVRKDKAGNRIARVKEDPNRVFLVKSPKGTFIAQRTGPGTTRVLYAFKADVPIHPQLHFDAIALPAAVASWDANFAAAIERAIATMR